MPILVINNCIDTIAVPPVAFTGQHSVCFPREANSLDIEIQCHVAFLHIARQNTDKQLGAL